MKNDYCSLLFTFSSNKIKHPIKHVQEQQIFNSQLTCGVPACNAAAVVPLNSRKIIQNQS